MVTYRRRKLNESLNRILNRIQKVLEAQPLRNADYYFSQFHLEHQRYLSLSVTGRFKELNLNKVGYNLDVAYMSNKLKQACFMYSHQAVFDVEYDTTMLEQVMELSAIEEYRQQPSISVYYEFLLIAQNGDLAEFKEYKKHLFAQRQYFLTDEFRDIYLLSLNFCIKKINEGMFSFSGEILDMYKKGLELELLFENKELTRFTYNNIVGIALRIDDLEWVENFMLEYKERLNISYREATYSLNAARLAFIKNNYDNALVLLQSADYDDLISHMTAKILQMKIYYELEEWDSLDYLLQALRIFIYRKRHIGYHYKIWQNIISYTRRIRQTNPYNKTAMEKLRKRIKAEKMLPEREWLLSKL